MIMCQTFSGSSVLNVKNRRFSLFYVSKPDHLWVLNRWSDWTRRLGTRRLGTRRLGTRRLGTRRLGTRLLGADLYTNTRLIDKTGSLELTGEMVQGYALWRSALALGNVPRTRINLPSRLLYVGGGHKEPGHSQDSSDFYFA